MSRFALPQDDAATKSSRSTAHQARAESDDGTLTNQTIIGMVQSKVGAGVIINAIRKSPGRYSLSPKSLIQLSAAGVPSEVIEAMQTRAEADPTTASASASVPQIQATSAWVTSLFVNKFDDVKTFQASRIFAVDSGALMSVNVTCGKNPFFSDMVKGLWEPVLSVYFRYLPARGSHVDFYENAHPIALKVSPDAFTDDATLTQQGGGTYVRMRALVNGTKKLDLEASSSGKPITAHLYFDSFFDVIAANEIQIEMPLNNGDAPVVKIEPQEATFREFALSCKAAYPPPKPPPPLVIAKDYVEEGNKLLNSRQYYDAIKSFEAALAIDRNTPGAGEQLAAACNLRPSSPARRPHKTDDPCAASVFGGPYFYFDKTSMWLRRDNFADVDFDQANQYCRNLTAGGFSDWRLPKIEELQPLVDTENTRTMAPSDEALSLDDKPGAHLYPAGNRWNYKITSRIHLSGPALWTSNPGKSTGHQMTFLQFIGSPDEERVTSAKLGLRALCTRDPRNAPPVVQNATASLPPVPKTFDQYKDEAVNYYAKGDYDNSIKSFQAALALKPDDKHLPLMIKEVASAKRKQVEKNSGHTP